jgi:hypothetical protein
MNNITLRFPVNGSLIFQFSKLEIPSPSELRNMFATFIDDDWQNWEADNGFLFLSSYGFLEKLADGDFDINEYQRLDALAREHAVIRIGYAPTKPVVAKNLLINLDKQGYYIIKESDDIVLDFQEATQSFKSPYHLINEFEDFKKGEFLEMGNWESRVQ